MPPFDSGLYMCDFLPCRKIFPQADAVLNLVPVPRVGQGGVVTDSGIAVAWFCSRSCLGRCLAVRVDG